MMDLNIIVVAVYRSPNANLNVFYETLEVVMTKLLWQYKPETRIYIAGDFNIDTSKENTNIKELLNAMSCLGLKPTVTIFTREANNARGSIQTLIDNVFTICLHRSSWNSCQITAN